MFYEQFGKNVIAGMAQLDIRYVGTNYCLLQLIFRFFQQKMQYLILRNVSIVYSKTSKLLSIQSKRCLVINTETGKIEENLEQSKYLNLECFGSAKQITFEDGYMLLPGLVDTHVHAPQFANMGTGLDYPLLQWLQKNTFPCEKKFQDIKYAKKVYEKAVHTHLRSGTTTISYFATIHLQATKILADIVQRTGMRGYVGKCCMDTNISDYVEESTMKSLKDTKQFISYVQSSCSSIVPILTPRFALSCSGQLMCELGKIATEKNLPIQTHLSENKAEIKEEHRKFKEDSSYTGTYQSHGLLGPKTILAHCVHLNESEIQLIKKSKSGVSHCPNSNTSLSSGMMPARKLLNKGVKMGLGTDVSGGYSPSIFAAMRSCISVSKLHAYVHSKQNEKPVTLAEAFWLGTRGGAELLGLQNVIGVLEKGWQFDALLINFKNMDCFIDEEDTLFEIFSKIIYSMKSSDILNIWIRGKQVYKST